MDIKDAFGTFGPSIKKVKANMLSERDPMAVRRNFQNFVRKGSMSMDNFPSDKNNDGDLRTYMSERCFRVDTPRFAVKRIRRQSSWDEQMTRMAMVDLAIEAKFLACMDHSNIIRLRATVGTPGKTDFMIVLDRLVDVLDQKVRQWKVADALRRGPLRLPFVGKEECRRLTTERVMAMFDVARALRHLHKHR
jgi:hypothetical protein